MLCSLSQQFGEVLKRQFDLIISYEVHEFGKKLMNLLKSAKYDKIRIYFGDEQEHSLHNKV